MERDRREQVFETWLGEHKGLLFKVVRAYSFTGPDQDDLFQEIAIQVWNSIPNYQGDSAVSTWLYRVALYTALAWTRKERKHDSGKEPIEGTERLLTETATFNDPRLEWLYAEIAQLHEVDRSLTLLWLDGFSYAEMASMLGISTSNVGVKINRIKKRLSEKSKERPL